MLDKIFIHHGLCLLGTTLFGTTINLCFIDSFLLKSADRFKLAPRVLAVWASLPGLGDPFLDLFCAKELIASSALNRLIDKALTQFTD